MSAVRSMLARVTRLERASTAPKSPFEMAYGSFEAFETETQAQINSGALDSRDMPIVLDCIRRWHDVGLWGDWRRDRVWELAR